MLDDNGLCHDDFTFDNKGGYEENFALSPRYFYGFDYHKGPSPNYSSIPMPTPYSLALALALALAPSPHTSPKTNTSPIA